MPREESGSKRRKCVKEETNNALWQDYQRFRSPGYGNENPSNTTNAFWSLMVSARTAPSAVRKFFGDLGQPENRPIWTFCRKDQTATALPTGETVFIGGEYGDPYDRDHWIYNDVVVTTPEGDAQIYCYPRQLFPPLSCHTATLVGDHIWVVGRRGYPLERQPGVTQVYKLAVHSWDVVQVHTQGASPSWLYGHSCQLGSVACHKGGPPRPVLQVAGGCVLGADGEVMPLSPSASWLLDLITATWHRSDLQA